MIKLIIALLFPIIVFSQQTKIVYPGYTSYYNVATKIPDSVIWMCKQHIKVATREPGFHSTEGRPNLSKDYAHSGYDIGHNSDASDMNGNKIDEYNSFDFCNTFPQLPNLNRKTWLALENRCRQIAPCKVKVSWKGIKLYIGIDRVAVPQYCIKEIWYGKTYEKYMMPNEDSVNKHNFDYYKIK